MSPGASSGRPDSPLFVVPGSARRARGGRGAGVLALLASLLLVFVAAPVAARRLTDWLWYRELGLERIFLTKIAAQWALAALVGLPAFAALYGSARLALRGVTLDALTARADIGGGEELRRRLAVLLALPGAVVFAALLALVAAAAWPLVLQFLYRTPFGDADPVFGRDVAFYVFTLPVAAGALGLAWVVLLLALVVASLIYLARRMMWRREWRVRMDPAAQRHLGALVALLFAVAALELHFVDVPSLLYSTRGPLVGASYADLHAVLPALRVLTVLAAAAAAFVLWAAWRGRLARGAALAVGTYVAAAAVLTGVVPALYRRLVVVPNELAREAPQLAHHIAATRRAWGLERVETRSLSGDMRLTARDIAANRATFENVRLWDREPLLQTFGQLQSIRTYYDFVAVDDDRYWIDGRYRQVLLSARELDSEALPTRRFINEHLTFTHGMGLTLGPSNEVSEEGLPVLLIKDLPPVSSVSLAVTRPEIYFGEIANEFVIVNTRQREFDLPSSGDGGDVFTSYRGRGGVAVSSVWRRALLALRFGSLNVLLSRDITPQSRALFYRRVAERARTAFPFLRLDGDPYLVITDAGRLVWILDAYTASDRYPYAQGLADGTNYLRNSIKVTIDAYDGDVRAYLSDPRDPIARTFARIYPGVFRPLDSLPADLRAHLRYPTDLFRAQALVYATFHMSEPETFYHREDQWQLPTSPHATGAEAFLRHIVMRLPGEARPEFLLMLPFTPRQKDNLAAWLVARNDGEHYGELVAYRFPRQSLVYGPRQVINRITQDTEVARQITLWDQRGSQVIWGDLLVIPIEQSLIYVQPLYLRAEGGRIPELKRVVVAHETRVVMAESLEAGLAALFGGTAAEPARAAPTAPAVEPPAAAGQGAARPDAVAAELLRRAVEHYERARAAQRAEDWAAYGAEMRRLGEVLRELERRGGRGP